MSGRIPFYRNVKVLAIIAQVVFLVLVLIVLALILRNVVSGIQRLGISADFGFLGERAGFDISEVPIPYTADDSFGRAMLVAIVNTLKVALPGVALATLLGIGLALMRLSSNWILRQIATVYIETIRNIPLVIIIFLFFTVLFVPGLPRGRNAIMFWGGGLLNNSGWALPWLFPGAGFRNWLPWLVAGLIAAAAILVVRRIQIVRSERPGNPWPPALAALVLIGTVGYFVASLNSAYPANLQIDFNPSRARITSYIDIDENGEFSRRVDRAVGYVPVRFVLGAGTVRREFPDSFVELRRTVYSTFRFPLIREREVESASPRFVDEELAATFGIEFTNYPSIGFVYQDRNRNGSYDRGEEADAETGEGFDGGDYRLVLDVTGFERRLVTGREGEVRVPRFDEFVTEPRVEILAAAPLLLSRPSIPGNLSGGGGLILTVAYLALVVALVVYTSTFIAEIVRGGILAVAKGQTEAAKALGLSGSQTFRLVVFPQAMRVIVPPMISQYLNLTKNSSLGVFAAYPDFFAVSAVIANQSGASVPIVLTLIVGYLAISLSFSLILNWYNERVKLVER